MSGLDEDKSYKAIQFSGKKEDYQKWSAKFLAYAHVKGFKKVLMGTETPPPAAEDLSTGDVIKKMLRKNNDLAYSVLHMAVKDDVSFNAIFSATTDDLPDGDARKAWKNLEKIFKPVSNASKHELEQKFNQCTLTQEDKNPDEFFSDLEKIKLQLKLDHSTTYDDDKMISQIVYNTTPNIYKTIIQMLKRDLNRGTSLTLSEVQDDLRQVYAQHKSSQPTSGRNNKSKNGDQVLAARAKPYKGSCHTCGKIGHKSTDCWFHEKNKSKRPTNYKGATESANTASNGNGNSGKSPVTCNWCQKVGHPEDKCFSKKNGKPKVEKESTNSTTQKGTILLCLNKSEAEHLLQHSDGGQFNPNVFIADSGATSHMRYSLEGMTDLIDHRVEITVGNNETMWTRYKGTYHGTVSQQDGTTMEIMLKDILYVPDLWVNLFSITKAITNPSVQLSNDKELIKLKIGDSQQILFDKVFKCGSGQLVGVDIKPNKKIEQLSKGISCQVINGKESLNVSKEILNVMKTTYQTFHAQLGHPSASTVKSTAKAMGIELDNGKETCTDCALGKSRVKNIPKVNTKTATEKLERINIDISYVNFTSFGGAKYWLLIQDEFTDCLWSKFLKTKDQVSEVMFQWINEVQKETKLMVKNIRCDNSGENKSFHEAVKADKDLKIKFEFTAPHTPQQNGKVERKFATLYGKMRAMLNAAKLTPYF
jgi:gag-polypeptide of LTR copia-type